MREGVCAIVICAYSYSINWIYPMGTDCSRGQGRGTEHSLEERRVSLNSRLIQRIFKLYASISDLWMHILFK